MTDTETERGTGTDREEPVGAPVVRGDPEVTGAHAKRAVKFDPDDAESLAEATALVREFAAEPDALGDSLYMLRGAAACAALVRGEGSYKAAANRAGEDITVAFLRKWARVHDLPISIRRHIATGDIPPSSANQIARVSGNGRFVLAWAILDNDLTVDEVRTIASEVNAGTPIKRAFREWGITPGEVTVTIPLSLYRELRRLASLDYKSLDDLFSDMLEKGLEK